MYIQWRLGQPQFLSRDARMCNRRCLHSNMIGMLCTASQGPSRTVQTALRCPRPKSFSLSSYWTGCRLCFVVHLVEEHVGEGGSRSSWPIHEHDSSELVSQQNVAIQVFGSQCQPRSALIARDLARDLRHGKQRVSPFYHDVFLQRWSLWFHERNVIERHLPRDLRRGKQRVSPFCHILTASSWKERVSISWERDVFLAPGAVLGSLPTTGVPVLSWSGFGFGWFDCELLHCWTTCPACGRWATSEPNSFIQSCFKETFRGDRGDAYPFSYMTSPVSIRTTFGIQ